MSRLPKMWCEMNEQTLLHGWNACILVHFDLANMCCVVDGFLYIYNCSLSRWVCLLSLNFKRSKGKVMCICVDASNVLQVNSQIMRNWCANALGFTSHDYIPKCFSRFGNCVLCCFAFGWSVKMEAVHRTWSKYQKMFPSRMSPTITFSPLGLPLSSNYICAVLFISGPMKLLTQLWRWGSQLQINDNFRFLMVSLEMQHPKMTLERDTTFLLAHPHC